MRITKMHGLGNDFIIIMDMQGINYAVLARELCARRTGVGADGLMVVCKSDTSDVRMRIFNADGSEAEMCGNGIRCFAKYVFERGIVAKTNMAIETPAGIMRPQLTLSTNNQVENIRVDMGEPVFERAKIPMLGTGSALYKRLTLNDSAAFNISALLMGVPHLVVFVENLANTNVDYFGPMMETHEYFPKKINVNFMQIIDKSNIYVSTWERGAGKTLACGTGSCACVVVASLQGMVHRKCAVHLPLGKLFIEYTPNNIVFMTGRADFVFDAEI